ncbi:hypothetical protein [Streptomyces sp. JS01]|uniref:hypothetical protein n=1 Tax=Streptomyces sp. JS01 TaxID=1525753 RepID=UPI0012FEF3C2|nr:hypothetical protein [Streptomyces sp. JS01]
MPYLNIRQGLLQACAHPLLFPTGLLHTQTMSLTGCDRERFDTRAGIDVPVELSSALGHHVQPDLTSMADINVGGRRQTVAVSYDYRHRSVSSLTWTFAAVTRMG